MSNPIADGSPPLSQLIDLTGRTAIVTGASMGIGRAIAERLHEAGARVVIADLDRQGAAELAGRLQGIRPESAIAVTADVGRPEDAAAMVAAAVDRFGSVDILVNNAGIYPFSPFMQMSAELFERVLSVNLVGVFLVTKAAVAQMIEQGSGGSIVNVTSVDAIHPSMIGLAHYDASKHGVWGLTKNIALELAEHRIRVNALAPGGVATPGATAGVDPAVIEGMRERIPMGRMADADEMARVALFLASDMSSYMTGSQVVADGGLLLR